MMKISPTKIVKSPVTIAFVVLYLLSYANIASAQSFDDLYGRARTAFQKGDLNTVESVFIEYVDLARKKTGARSERTAIGTLKLGEVSLILGKLGAAQENLQESLALYKEIKGANSEEVTLILGHLGAVSENLGRYKEAEKYHKEAIRITTKVNGGVRGSAVSSRINFAEFYRKLGRYQEAEEILTDILGLGDSETQAVAFNNLALVYEATARHKEAVPLYQKSLRIVSDQLGRNHPVTHSVRSTYAYFLGHTGESEQAIRLYLEQIRDLEQLSGSKTTMMALAASGLAEAYTLEERYADALPWFQRCLEIFQSVPGEGGFNIARSRANVAITEAKLGRNNLAISLAEESLADMAGYWRNVLSFYGERACLEFQKEATPMELAAITESGIIAARSQILFKGAVAEEMAQRKKLDAAVSKTQAGRDLIMKRDELRSQFGFQLLKGSGSIDSIRSHLEEVEKEIAILFDSEKTSEPLGVSLESVQSTLADGQTLVELFRYGGKPKNILPGPAQYAAVLITRNEVPVFVPIGEAKEIDSLIGEFRKLVTTNGEISANPESLKKTESTLYEIVLSPIEKRLPQESAVIFSPDALLHFLPLGMLRNSEGVSYSDTRNVRYVSSGRDLARKKTQPLMQGQRKALVIGNPSFRNNAPLQAMAEQTDEGGQHEMQFLTGLQFRPLVNTAREKTLLTSALEAARFEVSSLGGDKVTESEVVRLLPGMNVVHFATHGFFLAGLEADAGGSANASTLVSRLDQNPMYRSGLALSGAQTTFNLWGDGKIPPLQNDGVLLAAEVAMLDLQGADLVVLSACETALGKALDGEGVIGLRRAFYSAGAKNIVMTLWPVDDAATVEVMDAFYAKYLNGTPPPQALAEVQRELLPLWIQEHGEVKAMAWLAPFICTSIGPVE